MRTADVNRTSIRQHGESHRLRVSSATRLVRHGRRAGVLVYVVEARLLSKRMPDMEQHEPPSSHSAPRAGRPSAPPRPVSSPAPRRARSQAASRSPTSRQRGPGGGGREKRPRLACWRYGTRGAADPRVPRGAGVAASPGATRGHPGQSRTACV